MDIRIIAIGDELLTGKTVDTNSAFLGEELYQRGLHIEQRVVIPDRLGVIQEAIQTAAAKCDLLIVTGGLGPTSDDRTAEAVAKLVGGDLIEHAASRKNLERILTARGRKITEQVLKQILYPSASSPMSNSKGLAAGFYLKIHQALAFFLPGVPTEMKAMFKEEVVPVAESKLPGFRGVFQHRTWKCLGIPESELQILMNPIEPALPAGAYLGYRTKFPENYLTLYWPEQGEEKFEDWCSRIQSALGKWAYTDGPLDVEALILGQLQVRNEKIALAESCTGGLSLHRLTHVPGSSAHVWGGVSCYQVDCKRKLLGVDVRDDVDAVSEKVTRDLAAAIQGKSGAQWSGAITGYMGPTGGTESDPIGGVYLCVQGPNGIYQEKLTIPARERASMQWAASTYLLVRIYQRLNQQA